MSKLTADLGNIDISSAKPIAPVQASSSLRDTLGAASQVVVEGIKLGTTASLVGDLEELEQGFIQDAKEELSFEEQEELNTFSRRVKSLHRKAKVTQKSSEYRIRAEAMLKERINQFPGLASHYRKAASGLLGFNPEGAEASLMESQLKQQAQDAQAQLKFIDNDAVKRFNLEPGAVLVDPLAQMEYQAGLEAEAEKDDWKRLADIEKSKTSLGVGKYNSAQFRDKAKKVADDTYISVNNLVKAELRAAGIPSIDLKTGVKAEHWDKIDEGVGRALQARLETAMANHVAPLMQAIEDAPEGIKQSYKTQLEAPFKEMISLIDQKASLDEWENRSKLRTQILLNKYKDVPELQIIQSFAALGVQPDPSSMADVYRVLLEDLRPVFSNKDLDEEEQEQVVSAPDKTTTKYLFDSIKKQFSARAELKAPEGVDQEALDRTALNVYEAYASSGKVSRENFSAFFEAHAQEGAEEYINNLQKVSPLFNQEIGAAAVSFSERALRDTQVKVGEVIEKYTRKRVLKRDARGRATLTQEVVPFEINVDSTGFVSLTPSKELKDMEPELFSTTVLGSREVPGKLSRELKKLQTSYLKDLNNVVTTMSNVYGISKQEAGMQLFSRTGWIAPVEGEGGE